MSGVRLEKAVVADVAHRKSTLKSLSAYVKEHFSNSAYGVYPTEGDQKIAIIIVANKYSPKNYWSVRRTQTPA